MMEEDYGDDMSSILNGLCGYATITVKVKLGAELLSNSLS